VDWFYCLEKLARPQDDYRLESPGTLDSGGSLRRFTL